MNFTIKLNKVKSLARIEGVWNSEDYVNLLELFDFPDAQSIPESELIEMLAMAITDYEPEDAAEIVLKYKLGNKLKDGQIKSIAHEMLEDKISEEYPDITLHYALYNVNQLLYDSYNGKFPRTLASEIEIELVFKGKMEVTKEIIIRTISDLLSEKSLLKRLFNEQLDSSVELKDAESIVWDLKPLGENMFRIISSDYWLNSEDFEIEEFSGVLREDEFKRSEEDDD